MEGMRISVLVAITLPLFGGADVVFEPNIGQADPRVEFIARTPASITYFTGDETVFATRGQSIQMRLAGSHGAARFAALDPLGSKSLYFRGKDASLLNNLAPRYARLGRRAIYPGIDIVYYARAGRVEYDFHVAPGADPRRIEILYDAAAHRLPNGDISIRNGSAELVQHAPESYQNIAGKRVRVPSEAIASGNRVRFRLGRYDRSKPLVIDPVVTLSTTLGGGGSEEIARAVAKSDGSVFVVGTTDSTDFPLRSSSRTTAVNTEAFVSKFTAAGVLEYSAYIGGNGRDQARAVALDAAGAIYVAGTTTSTDFPAVSSYRSVPYGSGDAFLLKIQGTSLVYSTYFGGSDIDEATGVAVDSSGAAYLTGFTLSANLPVQNASQPQLSSPLFEDAFVAKFSPAGNTLVYSTYFGGGLGSEYPASIAVDAGGAAYIAGTTTSSDLPLSSPLRLAISGASDIFVAKLTPPSLAYSTYLGGTDIELAGDIAVDAAGFAHVAATTLSANYPAVSAYQPIPAGCAGTGCAVVSRLAPAGNQINYSTALSSTAGNSAAAIVLDPAGGAYIAGSTGAGFPIVNPPTGVNSAGAGQNAFLTQLNAGGNSVSMSAVIGGSSTDTGTAIARETNAVWLAGTTLSADYPSVQPAVPVRTPPEAFVTRIALSSAPNGVTILTPSSGQTISTAGVTLSWQPVSGSTGYGIRVTRGAAILFSGSLSGVNSTSTLINLPEGDFTAAVRSCANGFTDAACGPYSFQPFLVRLPKPSQAPLITSPAANAVLTASTHSLQWQSVAGANAYEVRVLRGTVVELNFRVSAPATSTIYSFGGGNYTMTVRACTIACGDWSAPASFSIQLPTVNPTPPVISSAVVNGGNSLTVSWNAVPGADLYLVQVVQPPPAGPGGGALTVASARTSSTTLTLPVPAGTASVFVAACNGDGCQANSAPVAINPAGPNPPAPAVGSPAAGTPVDGPVVLISWSRIPGDNGSNTTYRLYVQDLGRQSAALDVLTTANSYGAYFSPGTRYDILVIANPGQQNQAQGTASGFSVRGTAPSHATMVSPTHNGQATAGNVPIGWTPLPGSEVYQYFAIASAQPSITFSGLTSGTRVDVPLSATGLYNAIVRACTPGASCSVDSDAGWLPWSNAPGGSGIGAFTVIP